MAASLVTQVEEETQPSCCWILFCCVCRKSSRKPSLPPPAPIHLDPSGNQVLLPQRPKDGPHKKCLILDLDETLVHSSFKPIPDADFRIEINLEGTIHRVYVRKRPFVDEFLAEASKKWEIVVFTASLAKYADPLMDILDRDKVVVARLFRESCVQHYGNYVKDLRQLGRPIQETVIVDNSPFSYMFQPDNAIPITSWFNDRDDRELHDLLPFLDTLLEVDDVTTILERKNFPFLGMKDQMSGS